MSAQPPDRVFFYGLFMDTELLLAKGLHPETVGPAELARYQIKIGDKASLIPCDGATSYGLVIDLPADEAALLYSDPAVVDYQAEAVEVRLLDDDSLQTAACYNLPESKLGSRVNSEYARELAKLAGRLGFPAEYVQAIVCPGSSFAETAPRPAAD